MDREDFGEALSSTIEEYVEEMVDDKIEKSVNQYFERLDIVKLLNNSKINEMIIDMANKAKLIADRLRETGQMDIRIRMIEADIYNLKHQILSNWPKDHAWKQSPKTG